MLKKMIKLFKDLYSNLRALVKPMSIISFGGYLLHYLFNSDTLNYMNIIASYISDFLISIIRCIYDMQDISSKQNRLKSIILESMRLAIALTFLKYLAKLVEYAIRFFKVKKTRNSKF